jgi:hypothetical protein
MKRTKCAVKIFRSRQEHDAEDIRFYIRLTPRERQRIARELRVRYYGDHPKPIRVSRPAR